MLPEQLVGDCANLHHRWGAFEGFNFVGDAADVCVGGAFGLLRFWQGGILRVDIVRELFQSYAQAKERSPK